jgi:hypothetical protein
VKKSKSKFEYKDATIVRPLIGTGGFMRLVVVREGQEGSYGNPGLSSLGVAKYIAANDGLLTSFRLLGWSPSPSFDDIIQRHWHSPISRSYMFSTMNGSNKDG